MVSNERVAAPDLARGLMLAMIVLSNVVFHLWAAPRGSSGWHPADGSAADRVTQFLMIVLVDLRVYPLFAFLFGYGMARLMDRQITRGSSPAAAVRLVRRRSLLLIAFGLVHAALLLAGDILAVYGLISLVLGALFLRRTDRTLLVWAAIFAALLLVMALGLNALMLTNGASVAQPGHVATPGHVEYATGEENWLAAAGGRLTTWAMLLLAAPAQFGMHAVLLLGIWAARNRVLEEPARHRRLLVTTAAIGIPLGWLGALPSALAHVGLLDVPAEALTDQGELFLLQSATGVLAGLGYVAMFTLLATGRWVRRPLAVAVRAVGARSLSVYLAHSVLLAPVLAAWGLGLGAHLGSAGAALYALGAWALTLALAFFLERRGLRGPAETLLRRLLHRPQAAADVRR
ncbi:DUF418 domain-containing protein [Nonomuraea sp. NPDC050790]|uniref:DUF418 domain-containing protein n=1 Tax=Nonomuraea sp. NPDC050790 TaxID=3364371 RepID=UPI0037BE1CE6